MPYTIRQGSPSDCEKVAEINVSVWKSQFSGIVPQDFLDGMSIERRRNSFLNRFQSSQYVMYIAESAGEPVGFIDAGGPRNGPVGFDYELYSIYIMPTCARCGIGSELLGRCLENIKTNGGKNIFIRVLSVNPFKKFYLKNGATFIGSEPIRLASEKFEDELYSIVIN